jgi:hypothetical protein
VPRYRVAAIQTCKLLFFVRKVRILIPPCGGSNPPAPASYLPDMDVYFQFPRAPEKLPGGALWPYPCRSFTGWNAVKSVADAGDDKPASIDFLITLHETG